MLQRLLAFFDEVIPPSTASMASSNVLLIHLLLILYINNITSIKSYLFPHWLLCKRWRDILFVLCWLLLQSISHPLRHIQHHDLYYPSPNLQEVRGVHFGCTRGTYLILCVCPNFQKKCKVKVCVKCICLQFLGGNNKCIKLFKVIPKLILFYCFYASCRCINQIKVSWNLNKFTSLVTTCIIVKHLQISTLNGNIETS